MNTNNKGFIALSLLVWTTLIITTMISLQSAWVQALMTKDFYERERISLMNFAIECIEYAHDMYISGIGKEEFTYRTQKGMCWGKTGDILEATTTNSHFWYATTTRF